MDEFDMGGFEQRLQSGIKASKAEVALERRIRRLGVDLGNPGPKHRKVSQMVAKHEKKRVRLTRRMFERCPDNRPFSLTMTFHAQALGHAAGPYRVYPIFPGLGDMARFMQSVSSEGATIWSPWPVQQHLYLESDFAKVRDHLRNASELPDGDFVMDYSPLPEAGGDDLHGMPVRISRLPMSPEEVEDFAAADEDARRRQDEIRELGLPLSFYEMGSRVVSDRDGVHVLTFMSPATNVTGQIMRSSLEQLGAQFVPDGETNPLTIAIMTSVDRVSGKTSYAWFASQWGHVEESGFGYSATLSENRMYDGEHQIEHLSLLANILRPFLEGNLDIMRLPAYFEMQVDAVEDLGPAEAKAISQRHSAPEAEGHPEPKPDRVPSRFKIVKALRRPMAQDDQRDPAGMIAGTRSRAEPDTQVEVEGFWRRVRKSEFGKGPNGMPVLGKTWVKAHRRYKDKPAPEHSKVRVKEPLAPYLGAK